MHFDTDALQGQAHRFMPKHLQALMGKAQAAINSIANGSCTHRPREASLGPALRRGAGDYAVVEVCIDGDARRLG